MKQQPRILVVLTVFMLTALVLAGCGATPAPTTAPASSPAPLTALHTQPPATDTPVPTTPTPKGPTVGGIVRIRVDSDIDTLDPQRTSSGLGLVELGGSLIGKDPKTSQYIPYLAESWKGSSDGMTWEFELKKGVKFHDGSPVTAKDWLYTFQRAVDPETQSPVSAALLMRVADFEAPDDYTLIVHMAMPNYYILESFSNNMFMSPLSQTAVEKWGDQYGRHPVSVGPFKFKEWTIGEKLVVERNPDFTWGPAYTRGEPPYISTIEFVTLKEEATMVAALETGEIDIAKVEPRNLDRVLATDDYETFKWNQQGINPCVQMNHEKPPLDDVRVRQALNLGIDREVLIKTVALGYASIQYGPISSSVQGYWPGAEKIGYGYDLARASDLMKQAGYMPGSDGMLQKDGKPLVLSLLSSGTEVSVKIAQIVKEQYKLLGIEIDLITQGDSGVFNEIARTGEYELCVDAWNYGDASLMYGMFHSAMVGALNYARVQDPELDAMTEAMLGTADADTATQLAADVQKRIIENAHIIPLYAPEKVVVVSKRLHGARQSAYQGDVDLFDAWIDEEY